MGHSHYDWSQETAEHNLNYWNSETIQNFWTGESFQEDISQQYNYLLAQGLFNVICNNYGRRFYTFAGQAKREDAGVAAAEYAFECSLSDLAALYLGEGDWQPRPFLLKGEQDVS